MTMNSTFLRKKINYLVYGIYFLLVISNFLGIGISKSNLEVSAVDESLLLTPFEWSRGEVYIYTPLDYSQSLEQGEFISDPTLWFVGAYDAEPNQTSFFIDVEYGVVNQSNEKEYIKTFSRPYEVPLYSGRYDRPFKRFLFDLKLDDNPALPYYHVNISFEGAKFYLEYKMDIIRVIFTTNVEFVRNQLFQLALFCGFALMLALASARWIMDRGLYIPSVDKYIYAGLSFLVSFIPLAVLQFLASRAATKEQYFSNMMFSYASFVYFLSLLIGFAFLSRKAVKFLPRICLNHRPILFVLEQYGIVLLGENKGKHCILNDSWIDFFFNRVLRKKYQLLEDQVLVNALPVKQKVLSRGSQIIPVDYILFTREDLQSPASIFDTCSKGVVLDRFDSTLFITNLLEEYYIHNTLLTERFMAVSALRKSDTLMQLYNALYQDDDYLEALKEAQTGLRNRIKDIRKLVTQQQEDHTHNDIHDLFNPDNINVEGGEASD